MRLPRRTSALLPPWWQRYRAGSLGHDLLAGLIVALLLVPQGLAYATLAGVPPQYGLYASLLPLVFYALFGSSNVMSVGPVAITSLLTASALAPLGLASVEDYVAASAVLALLAGAFLLLAGILRLGGLAQLLSHPVVTAFITGAALLIIIGQLRPLLGLETGGHTAVALLAGVVRGLPALNPCTAGIGLTSLAALLLARRHLVPAVEKLGVPAPWAATLQRLMPVTLVILAMLLVSWLGWQDRVAMVGALPAGTPAVGLPALRLDWIGQLWLPAVVIGALGFIESIAVAQTFARAERQPLDANAELRGLGAANLGSALAGGFPVAGGFSRTLVNAEAGARSPVAGIFAALFVLVALFVAAGLFGSLPVAVLAAAIIAAALQLVDPAAFRRAWRQDRLEAVAMAATLAGVLFSGVEAGIALGVALSLVTVVWRSSRPHMAVVGRVPGTEHFRNVLRHQVETVPGLLILRVDENLFFANAEAVAGRVEEEAGRQAGLRDLVLVMSSVSRVDLTAVEVLERLNEELAGRQVRLHLAEVKGPVADRLEAAGLTEKIGGRVFLSTWQAFAALAPASE